ncbi:hypothetical protein F4804DRAFT_205222 [Jackrogersella minutella]|nr:hypothetical protein F4804DRAFT_205222 [Jackrogersella minutella]
MEDPLCIHIYWIDVPNIDQSDVEDLVAAVRKTILHAVKDKIFKRIPDGLKLQHSNIFRLECRVHHLPFESDFNMPSLLAIVDPSIMLVSQSIRTLPQQAFSQAHKSDTTSLPSPGVPTAYSMVHEAYGDLMPPERLVGKNAVFLLHKPACNGL